MPRRPYHHRTPPTFDPRTDALCRKYLRTEVYLERARLAGHPDQVDDWEKVLSETKAAIVARYYERADSIGAAQALAATRIEQIRADYVEGQSTCESRKVNTKRKHRAKQRQDRRNIV